VPDGHAARSHAHYRAPTGAHPDQLTLGELDPSASASAPAREPEPDSGADEGQVAVREPPVCGEWSFDADESPESARRGRTVHADTRRSRWRSGSRSDARKGASRGRPTPGHQHQRVPPPAASRRPPPLPALDELKSIHDAHPGDEQTAMALSNALAKRGNIEGALGVLQRAIDAGADTVTLRCARATILSGRLRYRGRASAN